MHTLDINSSNVPAFLIKLWKLVEDASCDDLIAWGDSGASFIIKDQARFARELLPQYFKHNNMASFIRQLNMYGFRKVMNYEKSGLRNESNDMEFQHAFFVKEQSELLELIKRKIPNTKVVAETHMRSNPKDILTDLTSIRDKQENMDNMLMKMKRENELLWKELTNMRQKHKQQEQVIEKVIQFLLQILQNRPVGVGIQRKLPRMLHDSPGNKGSTSHITTIDIMQNKPECIIVQDKSSSGPVIHEVTDMDIEEPLAGSAQSPIIQIKSPASKSSSKSPAPPNIVVFSPAEKSSNNKDDEAVNLINDCPLDSSSLNSPINSAVPIEPLSILDPLHPRTPIGNEDETEGEDSILDIPLEYITANDVMSSMNIVPVHNIISIPEDNIVSNVISIPEGTEISDVISIPAESNISEIISASTNNSSKTANASASTTENINSIPDANINNNDLSTPKNNDSVTIPDFYDLQPDSEINIKSPLNSSLVNHEYIDPLMSDSLQTPKVSLDELGLTDFAIEDAKKQEDSSKKSSLSTSMDITQREHDYPATMSSSPNVGNSNLTKNSLSNHLLAVEEHLTRLQDSIASNSWNVDSDKLLGVCHSWATTCFPQLFSPDGIVSNDSFVSQLTDDIIIKKEPDDVLGNEHQFNPNFLDVELDELRSPFLNQLDPDVLGSTDISGALPDKDIGLLKKELTDATDEENKNSQASKFLSNDSSDNFPNKRRKIMRLPKNKSKRRLK